jgi:L-ascorbate 6-phosphate lactonase
MQASDVDKLAQLIRETEVAAGHLAVFYLAQAGFCFKDARHRIVAVDPYLSDACNRLFGFRRIIPSVITPGALDADIVASTHAHADHLDPDATPILARNTRTHFLGAPDCEETYRDIGIPPARYSILRRAESATVKGIGMRAVFADHGELAPDAIGLLIDFDGVKVYDVGDSAYAPDEIMRSLNSAVDIMISPINGRFGNMDAEQTCRLAAVVRPKVLIASHFWMFIEHGGDPARFLEEAKALPAGIEAVVMAPGEMLVLPRDT